MNNILIAGTNSYIGESFKAYIDKWPDKYNVSQISTKGLKPTQEIFKGIDIIVCVAGIAHIKETSENRHLYFDAASYNKAAEVFKAFSQNESGAPGYPGQV